jgi:hypothetical protein
MIYPSDLDIETRAPQDRSGTQREPDHSSDLALREMLRSHDARERELLASYEQLAEQSEDEGVRYLVRLILEDEARHHEQISEMLNNVQSLLWERNVDPQIPSMSLGDDRALRETAKRLLAFEREDAKELRRLRKELRRSRGYELLPLVVDTLLHDTAKHIDVLRFMLSRSRRH